MGDTETYSTDITKARDFRVLAREDGEEFSLEWMIVEGTIMTVTTIKISRVGMAETLRVLDAIRDRLP